MHPFRIALAASLVLTAPTGPTRAGEADCTAILDATVKMAITPTHQKISITRPGGKPPIESDVIRIEDTMYMQVAGHWVSRPYDGPKLGADMRQALATHQHTCSKDAGETVDGQPADVYRIETVTPQGKSQSKIWISPSSGLPLRQHTVLAEGAAANGAHDVRYDYTNVTPPVGAK